MLYKLLEQHKKKIYRQRLLKIELGRKEQVVAFFF